MRDFTVVVRGASEEITDPLNLERPLGRMIVGTGYHDQYFVVEEIGQLMRVVAGPFSTHRDACEAVLLLQGRSLRSAS